MISGCPPSGLGTIPGRATNAALAPAARGSAHVPGVGSHEPDPGDRDAVPVGDEAIRLRPGLELLHLVGREHVVEQVEKAGELELVADDVERRVGECHLADACLAERQQTSTDVWMGREPSHADDDLLLFMVGKPLPGAGRQHAKRSALCRREVDVGPRQATDEGEPWSIC